jgi:excisionase family DNA binding protein
LIVQTNPENLVHEGLDRIDEAAAFLKISRSQIYTLMDAGELVYVKIGRSRRIPHRALIELAARHLNGE